MNAVGNGTSDTIIYKCRMGYRLKGDNASVCILDGYWTEPNATCDRRFVDFCVSSYSSIISLFIIAVICPPPPKLPNMMMTAKHFNATQNVYQFGNMANFECLEGYRMYGNKTIRCLANGKWTRMQGKCLSICFARQSPFYVWMKFKTCRNIMQET